MTLVSHKTINKIKNQEQYTLKIIKNYLSKLSVNRKQKQTSLYKPNK